MTNQPKSPTAADWASAEAERVLPCYACSEYRQRGPRINGHRESCPGQYRVIIAAALLAAERRGREQAAYSEGMSFDEYRKKYGVGHGAQCRKCGADLVCRERGKSDEK